MAYSNNAQSRQNQGGYKNNNSGQGDDQKKYRKESDYDKTKVVAALNAIREQYARTLARHGLNAEEEIAFLWSIFTSNLGLLERACEEPEQLKRALLTQASVGLSLDPSRQLSYIVDRKYKLIWDIGYKGILKIAVDEGMITSAKPELVYATDKFLWRGQSEIPIHTNDDSFGDCGPIVGAYVVAYLPSGRVMVEKMKEAEFVEIAALNPGSDAWKKEFSKGEMRKKTLIKRASKWWYNASSAGKHTERLDAAITHLNEEAGEGIPTDTARETEAPEEPQQTQIPSDEEIPEPVRARVAKLIERARKSGAWKPCADYMREQASGPPLAWALEKLRQAEERANSDQEPLPAEPSPE